MALALSTTGSVLLDTVSVTQCFFLGPAVSGLLGVTAGQGAVLRLCSFKGNRTPGAAVQVTGTPYLTVENSIFAGNSASSQTGIAFLPNSHLCEVLISDSEFTGNKGGDGTLLYFTNTGNGGKVHLTVKNCVL
ncbi:MAG: hypothetical protein J0651_02880, partial [Actinobacteria bacterium]|nr:hypothetical protein [Actinomycetota bacterium]